MCSEKRHIPHMQLTFALFSHHQAAWQAGCGHACVESLDSVLTLNCGGREKRGISLCQFNHCSFGYSFVFNEVWGRNSCGGGPGSWDNWPQEQWRETGLRCKHEGSSTSLFAFDAAKGTGRLYILPESDLRGFWVMVGLTSDLTNLHRLGSHSNFEHELTSSQQPSTSSCRR